jgi:hypothetical protein
LVFPSAGLSPDSSFSPAHELRARGRPVFISLFVLVGSEVFMGFALDFADSFFSVSAQLLVGSKFFSLGHSISHVFFAGVFTCFSLLFFMPLVLSAQELIFLLN